MQMFPFVYVLISNVQNAEERDSTFLSRENLTTGIPSGCGLNSVTTKLKEKTILCNIVETVDTTL